MALALGGVLVLELLLLFAGALGSRVSDVANAPEVLLADLVHFPVEAAGVVGRVERALLVRDVQAIASVALDSVRDRLVAHMQFVLQETEFKVSGDSWPLREQQIDLAKKAVLESE